MDPPSAEGAPRRFGVQQALQLSRPARGLIERVTLDRTSADDQDAEQAGLVRVYLAATLTVRVDVVMNARLYFGTDLTVLPDFEALAGRPHAIARVTADPPAGDKLGRDDQDCAEIDDHPDGHAPPPAPAALGASAARAALPPVPRPLSLASEARRSR